MVSALSLRGGYALAACPTTPVNYNANDCSVDVYGTPTVVCESSGNTFSCDVSFSEDDAFATIVTDYDTSSSVPHEAWGSVEVNGSEQHYCCNSDPQLTITNVEIKGSDYGDLLGFTYSSLAYNLSGYGGATVAAVIDAGDGPDVLNGSHASGSNISETLNGGAGGDTIRGNADDDTLNGDDGDDVMLGGGGADTLNGGNSADEMLGGDGNDAMYGGAGRDLMAGGNGDDYLHGGTEGDTMCGDAETLGDELHDGDATNEGTGLTDLLWAANVGDVGNNLQDSSTARDSTATCIGPGCSGSAILSSRPACP